ncbi:MAG: bifunctional NADP-dependent methylenetetrahydromethanopterin dehydrogenase/methylenetetrahydrofolate dehydrogenase [Planctomycetaceae bacterium]|nr:bifunctional NADP-dependent methylenetetrahydromethanopterin dehydrogenase/methylenetetrahydrofolate dehydrogenase [Planctomycetaceae bacterium]
MKKILIQLDTDQLPSSFDRVVALDAGADELLSYGGVTPDNIVPLVHGAIFTRGPGDLKNTAIFVGGSDVHAAEKVFEKVQQTFFGPMRVSTMIDANGSETTAAAAVRSASKHISFQKADALVLGGTGPVGQRTAELLASQGARVRVASRSLDRAKDTVSEILNKYDGANVVPCECSDDGLAAAVDGIQLLFACGAAGVQFLTAEEWRSIDTLKVAVDVNAVPPVGLDGISVTDKAEDHNGIPCYGAIGVGGLKMKIHKAAIQRLFQSNDQVLKTDAIYALSNDLT